MILSRTFFLKLTPVKIRQVIGESILSRACDFLLSLTLSSSVQVIFAITILTFGALLNITFATFDGRNETGFGKNT
jgi:hypothetical protein